jgi:hypothetical protein
LSRRRPGSPPPELLTYEGTWIAKLWEWHERARGFPLKCQTQHGEVCTVIGEDATAMLQCITWSMSVMAIYQ